MSANKYLDFAKEFVRARELKTLLATAEIAPHQLVKLGAAGVAVSTLGAVGTIGAEALGHTVLISTYGSFKVSGKIKTLAVGKIVAGEALKSFGLGQVGGLANQDTISVLIMAAQAGGNFGNQPADDVVEVVSSDNNDKGQIATVYGIETTTGHFHSEALTLNGTTFVTGTIHFDRIHAVTLNASCAGTVTFREGSADQPITTLTTGVLQKGIYTPSDGRAFGRIPLAFAGGASSKYVVVIGTDTDGVAKTEEIQLNGAVDVPLAAAYAHVTTIRIGDVASASVVSLQTAETEDDIDQMIGISLDNATNKGDLIEYAPR